MSLIGQTIDRYRILEQLGQGGMAVVYKAYDTRLEREVAIKVIRTENVLPSQYDRFLKRFEQEAKAQANFSHPNIVKVHDYGEYDGAPYLVMEYHRGGTLKNRIGRPMSAAQAAALLTPIADALSYAHDRKILHRDVKPSNILIDERGTPLLTDFGIARLMERESGYTITGTGMSVGTPEYMALEQWKGQPLPQSDVYGLGVVLYQLVTGLVPYSADTPEAVLIMLTTEPLPLPRQFAADLPESAEKTILKALALKPEDRYESMAVFGAELARLANQVVLPESDLTGGLRKDQKNIGEGSKKRQVASGGAGNPSTDPPEQSGRAKNWVESQETIDVIETGSAARPASKNGSGTQKRWVAPVVVIVVLIGIVLAVSQISRGRLETRKGGWLDQITMTVVGEDSAIREIQAGTIDIYASRLTPTQYLEAADAAGLERSLQFYIYYDVTFNPSGEGAGNIFPGTGKLNPFSNSRIREAMNWLIDRNYINQEIYGGSAIPKFSSFVSGFPEYERYREVIRTLEAEYAYDFERAEAVIVSEMQAMGAVQDANGIWQFRGQPVEVIFLIRTDSDGTRVPMGDYISNQLESIGFTVTRQYGTSSELSALWVSGNIDDGLWHLYTGAWGAGNITRNAGGDFQFFYSPNSAYAFTTLWQSYNLDPEDLELYDNLANNAFTSLDERDAMMARALESTFKYNYRLWVVDGQVFSPWQPNVSVAYDLAVGVEINPLWPHTLRFDDAEGGNLNWGTPDLFVDPANPVGGSNWTYDLQWQLATQDTGTLPNPVSGLPMPQRIERAEVVIQAGLPVSATDDWVDLSFADRIEVPADAWIDWNPATETFITVGERYPNGLTATVKSVVYYPAELYEVTWHDGSRFDVADVVMGMIMTFATGTEGSPIYNEGFGDLLEAFQDTFRGFRIVSEMPLVVEYYTDVWNLDAELNVYPLWPHYGYGDAPWHVIAISNLAEAADQLAYTAEKAEAAGSEWMNYLNGPSLTILRTHLEEMTSQTTIPFSNTLSRYITAAEASARYQNLTVFYNQHGHFWVGTGSYILDQVYWTEKRAVLVRNPDYIDPSSKWERFIP